MPSRRRLQRLLRHGGHAELVDVAHREVVVAELVGHGPVGERLAHPADADLHEVLRLDDAELEGPRPLRAGPVLGLEAHVEVRVEGDDAELALELAGQHLQHGDGDRVVAAEDEGHGAGGDDVGQLLVRAQERLLDVAGHDVDVAVVDHRTRSRTTRSRSVSGMRPRPWRSDASTE